MSKAILIALVLGIGAGVVMPENVSGFLDTASSYMLLILLFSVGIDMGVNREVFGQIRRMGLRILVIPLGVILGSLAGGRSLRHDSAHGCERRSCHYLWSGLVQPVRYSHDRGRKSHRRHHFLPVQCVPGSADILVGACAGRPETFIQPLLPQAQRLWIPHCPF